MLAFVVNKNFKNSDSLLKPQCEVGGVTYHSEQVWRVFLLVLFGPDAANQLRRSDSSVKESRLSFIS